MAGRKRIEIDLSKVAELAGMGLTEQEICLCLGISDQTLLRRKHESVEFVDAIKRGKAKAAALVSNKLFERACNGDLGAIVWYEKTRCGRSDKMDVSVAITEAKKRVDAMSDEDLLEALGYEPAEV